MLAKKTPYFFLKEIGYGSTMFEVENLEERDMRTLFVRTLFVWMPLDESRPSKFDFLDSLYS